MSLFALTTVSSLFYLVFPKRDLDSFVFLRRFRNLVLIHLTFRNTYYSYIFLSTIAIVLNLWFDKLGSGNYPFTIEFFVFFPFFFLLNFFPHSMIVKYRQIFGKNNFFYYPRNIVEKVVSRNPSVCVGGWNRTVKRK